MGCVSTTAFAFQVAWLDTKNRKKLIQGHVQKGYYFNFNCKRKISTKDIQKRTQFFFESFCFLINLVLICKHLNFSSDYDVSERNKKYGRCVLSACVCIVIYLDVVSFHIQCLSNLKFV